MSCYGWLHCGAHSGCRRGTPAGPSAPEVCCARRQRRAGCRTPVNGRAFQFFAVHARPAVTLERVPAAFREHDQGTVVADGRDGLDEPPSP